MYIYIYIYIYLFIYLSWREANASSSSAAFFSDNMVYGKENRDYETMEWLVH